MQAEGAAAFRVATEGCADVARGMLTTHSWWAAMPLEMRSESSLRLMGNLQARHMMYERGTLLVNLQAELSWRLQAAWVPMSKAGPQGDRRRHMRLQSGRISHCHRQPDI